MTPSDSRRETPPEKSASVPQPEDISSAAENNSYESKRTETPDEAGEFVQQAAAADAGIVREFLDFLIHNKKWWLVPILLMLLLLGALVFLAGSPLAPFIYPGF